MHSQRSLLRRLGKLNPMALQCIALLVLLVMAYIVARYRLSSPPSQNLTRPGAVAPRRS
jgi:hypothetical protein